MDTKPQLFRPTPARSRAVRGAALAAACCAGLFTVFAAAAQDAVENAAIAKGTAAAPMALGRAPMQMTISMAPAPAAGAAAAAAAVPLRGPSCVGEMRESTSVSVPLGKSLLVPLDEPVRNRTIGNPAVAQATMVSPRTLYLVGMSVGTTNMIVQGKSGACRIIDVAVGADAGGLQASLRQLMPRERDIRVSTAADTIVLAGNVSSAQAAQQAVAIAKAYSNRTNAGAAGSGGGARADVLNMLTVTSPQQVMLEVKVAEVSKTLINQMGSAVNIQGGFGSWTGALVTSLLTGVGSGIAASKSNKLPLNGSIDAQNTDQPVKILAEPRLVTISGQEATFLAGGKIFIPVPQSSGIGTNTITLQEEEFGVGLKFTPTVLSNGRISLKVAPEVSELSPTGVTLSAANVGNVSILPLITTRRASTTVQMGDGETFAIGGLIKDNAQGTLKALPGIGELPVLGALFRSTSFQQDRTELVFIITPHLVQPLETADVPLPTDSFTKPNEADVYATGNMEGRGGLRQHGAAPAAAPANAAPGAAAPTGAAPAAAVPAPAAPAAPAAAAAPAKDAAASPAPAKQAPIAAQAPAPQPAKPAASAPAPANARPPATVQAPPPALPSAAALAQRQGAHAAAPDTAHAGPAESAAATASPAPAAALAAPAAAGATAKRQGAQPPQQLANAGAIAPAADR
ncbi:type II and III secretion system protein family protein [Burkholderia pseudomallei]|uniref:type II and III secretion system protein family protein n=3 Tax=Burkholderia pseudomallei TaxID=28450 RepID=UPI0005E261CC|nr:type II and III secretion system protein family protein [Burkholderia pseudomallei]ALC59554.1 secretin [Burkholderia pseudomallei]MBD2980210.1 type II and III secretion system protein family protein [Burkholderia pseudomallei]MBD3013580.1 type II and III secretion system protein family protein [Burkholderia pseudomallei]MCW0058066.1 type II and III secretion system protein family protein [Burkholderia pseudomallei]CAJ3021518.1 phospholipid-binding domain-containing protein [Burkholderia pse